MRFSQVAPYLNGLFLSLGISRKNRRHKAGYQKDAQSQSCHHTYALHLSREAFFTL
jgi:hypothetical protein